MTAILPLSRGGGASLYDVPGKSLASHGDGDVNDASSPSALAGNECAGIVPVVPSGPCGPKGSRLRGPRRPPVECGDLPFLIKRDGTWLYRGTPILRKELVCLFAGVLARADDGSFWLETPAERGRIEVEDAPFVAVELDWTGEGKNQVLSFRTNVDQVVTADPEHPIRVAHDILTCEPTPYLLVRPGAGPWAVEARINRAVYYELIALGVPEWVGGRHMLGVWSCGRFFPLGELPQGND